MLPLKNILDVRLDPAGKADSDIMARARAERAKVMSAILNGAGRALGALGVTVMGRLRREGRSMVSRAVLAHNRRRARLELESLDDRILQDIGISRSQIPFLVDQRLSPARARSGERDGDGKGRVGHGTIAVIPVRHATPSRSTTALRPAALRPAA